MAGGPEDENKKTVLVVDDFSDGREMYAEYFSFKGFNVETAKDGDEALVKAKEDHPDVILMDLSLPHMSGYEATRRLKQDATTKDIPVVAITGHVLGKHQDDARDAGCDDFIAKPALPQDVEAKIRQLLRGGKKPGAK